MSVDKPSVKSNKSLILISIALFTILFLAIIRLT